MKESEEIWKDVIGYEGLYQVSNLGRVKSLDRFVKARGESTQFKKSTILRPTDRGHGYLAVRIYNEHKKTRDIHQLVAESFLGHKPDGHNKVINHIDFNILNNNVDNLEIVTSRENSNKKHLKSTSKHIGVYLNKQTKKWMAGISVKSKWIHLGTFVNENEASKAYQSALLLIDAGDYNVKKVGNCIKKSSKFKNVFRDKRKNKWRSWFSINGKIKYLGSFDKENDAYLSVVNFRKDNSS